MLHEAPFSKVAEVVSDLNQHFKNHSAADVLDHALSDDLLGPIALVSSFGAESVVLLHMVAVRAPKTPVLFLNTQMLFDETLEYQHQVADKLGLEDVRIIRPVRENLLKHDVDGILHLYDTDACCSLRKMQPLQTALKGFDSWITGRKRFQGGTRTELDFFEFNQGRVKVNPLAHWSRENITEYMENNNLPRHPLVAQGYPSIGCAPCTAQVSAGGDPRSGRWAGQDKTECGIHFINGRPIRGPKPQEDHL